MTTPNTDLTPATFQIGKWTAQPFTLHTAILLERINSPFMKMVIDPATGKAVPVIPTLEDVAKALYIIVNGDKPFIVDQISDPDVFSREIANMTASITMLEFAKITAQLNDMMKALNTAMTDSGTGGGSEKNVPTGPSA